MSEIYKVPIPLSNYLDLIKKKRSPYYDLIQYLIADMERNLKIHPHNGMIYHHQP